jgi:8-oxo-dGTP pyrophosphatase MutT (NUDIX family)
MNPDDDQIRERLRSLAQTPRLDFKSMRIAESFTGLKESAVLIPLRSGPSGLEIVLTKRSEQLRKHAGEISFPGGRKDPEDPSLVHTALRETWEEVGIPPHDVQIYGALLRMPTVTGFAITAYVGEFTPTTPLIPNPEEIDELIVAPIGELANPEIHRVEDLPWHGETYPVHYFDFRNHNVWGATGFMLHEFFRFLGLR